MAIFKCKMCGGTIEFEQGDSVGVCDSCGTKQTLPRLNDEKKSALYDRANHFRRNNEFDKAVGIYEQILDEDTADAEAYWSLVLCKYGIEYVEDPGSHKRIPTVNRTQYTSVFDDENYKSALQYADEYQREIYEEEAKAINEIQKEILAISQKEEPFDVFICYKETDDNGRRTQDSVLANDLYHQLTNEGFKVFFSRITLEDKLGTAYEPYIFAALNSAKVMVVLGTRPEYFNVVWVKNEWSRYLALVRQSGGKKALIPAYRDMEPYDLPEEFSHLQAQDMSKLGFMQDLIRGIKKIAGIDAPKTGVKEVGQGRSTDNAALLERTSLFLMDKDWKSVNEYCEKILDRDAECAEAYLYKLMAEMQVSNEIDIGKQVGTIKHNSNYRKIMLFGSDELKRKLEEYDNSCEYNYAVSILHDHDYKSAKTLFVKLNGYKDSENKIAECSQKIEQEQAEKEKHIENLRKENAQLADKKQALNEKRNKLSGLGVRLRIISLLLFSISAIMDILWMWIDIEYALDMSEEVVIVGIIVWSGVAIVGPLVCLIIYEVYKLKTGSSNIDYKLKIIDNATQSNEATIGNYENTKPILNTFPDVGTKSTNLKQNSAPPFLMTVSDTFFITGRGTVVTGTVSIGTIRIGDTVQIESQQYQVLGIEAYQQTISSASAGMEVGLLIDSGNVKIRQGTSVTMMAGSNANQSY